MLVRVQSNNLSGAAYLLGRCFGQVHHVLMVFDFPRFHDSECTNEMTFNKAVGFGKVFNFRVDICKAVSVRTVLRENEDQLPPRRKAGLHGIGHEVGHQI